MMAQLQPTRPTKSLFTIFLLVSLQISLLNGHPLSTTQHQLDQGTPLCDPNSNQSSECVSVSSSPSPSSCSAHQREWDRITTININEYLSNCNHVEAQMKNNAGTLNYSDIVNCYRPQCNDDEYLIKQCGYLFSDWCWCSTPEGQAIPNTFQKNMPDGYCTIQQHCEVDGNRYHIDSIFTPPSVCGLCECHSDGTHTCFTNYTVDVNGHLSNEQLETLKKDVIQVFKLQYNQMPVDVQQISKMSPVEVSDNEKIAVLSSKFTSYDTDNDGALNHFEEFNFHKELTKLFGCTKFFDHLHELMDSNQDGEISPQEWNTFFGVLVTGGMSGDSPTQSAPQKREAPLDIRKPFHLRKKFQYVIS